MPGVAESIHDKKCIRGYCALCTAHCATIATVENGRVTRLDADHDRGGGSRLGDRSQVRVDVRLQPRHVRRSAARLVDQRRGKVGTDFLSDRVRNESGNFLVLTHVRTCGLP